MVREGIRALFGDFLWVEGQVSNLHAARSGHLYFDLLAVRRSLPDLVNEPVVWTDGGHGPVISYRRGSAQMTANTPSGPQTVAFDSETGVVYATPGSKTNEGGRIKLPSNGATIRIARH